MWYNLDNESEVLKIDNEKERNYSKEYQTEKKAVKRYTVKIQKDIAKLLDDRLKQNGDTFTGLVKNAIEKYLKKN